MPPGNQEKLRRRAIALHRLARRWAWYAYYWDLTDVWLADQLRAPLPEGCYVAIGSRGVPS